MKPGIWESEQVGPVGVVISIVHYFREGSGRVEEKFRKDLLNAAGTPMMMPSPLASSLLKSTSFPGDFSTRGTDGMESPTLTMLTI